MTPVHIHQTKVSHLSNFSLLSESSLFFLQLLLSLSILHDNSDRQMIQHEEVQQHKSLMQSDNTQQPMAVIYRQKSLTVITEHKTLYRLLLTVQISQISAVN